MTRPCSSELRRGDTTYYVVGTAHVSQRSVDEVRDADRAVHPDVVCVELDAQRHDALTGPRVPRFPDVLKVVREGKLLYLLAHLALAAYQRRIGTRLGVKPGAELLAALDAARELGARVELIDRDINITLRRTWAALSLAQRAMLAASIGVALVRTGPITAETVEALKEPKALAEMLAELARAMPEIKGPLLDERDQYLAERCSRPAAGRSGSSPSSAPRTCPA